MTDDTYRGYTAEQVEERMKEGLTAWASAKWPHLAPVLAVEFDVGYDAGWSEYTPGDGAYTTVTLTLGRRYCADCEQHCDRKVTRQLDYSTELINELLFFMFVGELPR